MAKTHRSAASAAKDNARSKVRKKSRKLTAEERYRDPQIINGPISQDRVDYSDEEAAFLKAVDAFRTRYSRRFLSACEYLLILKLLGYRKEP